MFIMVQYLHTPWRDRAELLKVRQQFYPSAPAYAVTTSGGTAEPRNSQGGDDDDDDHHHSIDEQTNAAVEAAKQHAVSRVSMWMQRGGCPHLVESTALLTAAILSDLHETRSRANSSSYAIRAAYSAAFSRFVTGLLDSQQDKQRKMSMYSIAKTIGLPATFVELRHQATHEQLPSLSKLRTAAEKALAWIWDYYWKNLPGDGTDTNERLNACQSLLLRYLGEESLAQAETLLKQLKQWDEVALLQNLAEIGDSSADPKIISRSLRLSQAILDGDLLSMSTASKQADKSSTDKKLDAIKADVTVSNFELDTIDAAVAMSNNAETLNKAPPTQTRGWSKYKGPWKPRPIGVV